MRSCSLVWVPAPHLTPQCHTHTEHRAPFPVTHPTWADRYNTGRGASEGDLGHVPRRAWGLQTGGRMDGQASQAGGGGPRAHLHVSVILYSEFMLGGLLNVLKLAGLPLPHSLHLGEEQAL